MDGETGGRGKLDEQRSLERRSHLGRRPSDVRRNKVGKVRRFKYRGTPWKGAFNPRQHSPNRPITMSDKRSGCWGHGDAPRNEHHGIRIAQHRMSNAKPDQADERQLVGYPSMRA